MGQFEGEPFCLRPGESYSDTVNCKFILNEFQIKDGNLFNDAPYMLFLQRKHATAEKDSETETLMRMI